jgi:hypothetical protein
VRVSVCACACVRVCVCVCVCVCVVLGIEPRALFMLGKLSTTELYLQLSLFFFLVFS